MSWREREVWVAVLLVLVAYLLTVSAGSVLHTLTGFSTSEQGVFPPDRFSATVVGPYRIDIAWQRVGAPSGATYNIYRNDALLASVDGTFFADITVVPATTYTYAVSTVSPGGGESARSASSTRTTPRDLTDHEPPSQPDGLSTIRVTKTSAEFSWNPSTDDIGVVGYRVYRDGELLGSTSKTWYRDSGLAMDTSYQYQVSAFDASDKQSANSRALRVTTAAPDRWDDVKEFFVRAWERWWRLWK